MSLNCWEYNQCGFEANGSNASKYGVCPVARLKRFDGINQGKNAGRICWVIKKRYNFKGWQNGKIRESARNVIFINPLIIIKQLLRKRS